MVKKELSIYDELGEERKRLQAEGKLPEWVTTPAWQILKENYLTEKHPDLLSVYTRISTHAASYTPEPELWREKFFNLLWKGWLAASSPVLSNMGTGIGCAVSCSGGYINDSVYDFYDAQKEAAVLSKNGFGTSGYLGAIRPRGSKIAGMKEVLGLVILKSIMVIFMNWLITLLKTQMMLTLVGISQMNSLLD
jgi:ribonucleoside-diphosphate reductase alpha chain